MNTMSDPKVARYDNPPKCRNCGRYGHTARKCSAISRGTEEDIIFFSMVASTRLDTSSAFSDLVEETDVVTEAHTEVQKLT